MPGKSARCARISSSLSRWPTSTQLRAYTAKVLTGDDLGPIHQDDHQSFRVLKDGKTLPLSPVLDPVVLSKRSRWEQPKAKPNVENFTPFQKKLSENPYGHALASPVRVCRATSTLLPSSLLVSLHPRPHPTTSEPWLLPVSLTTSTHHLGPPYRFLGHKYVAAHLSKKKNWEKGVHLRFIEKLGKKKVDSMIWREDMPNLIEELLRNRVLNKLRWHFKQSGQLVACPGPQPEAIGELDDVSCVLYLGSLRTRADSLQAKAEDIVAEVDKWVQYYVKSLPKLLDPHKQEGVTHLSPSWYTDPLVPRLQPRIRFPLLAFGTMLWRGRKIAVYSLPDLLGDDKALELIRGSKFEGERCLVMKTGRHNVSVEILLMQLEAYSAIPGP